MVSVGTGRVLNFLEGINKKGNPYRLLEIAGSDYKKCSIRVPESMVADVKAVPVQSDVNISYSLESNNGYLNAELLSIQKK